VIHFVPIIAPVAKIAIRLRIQHADLLAWLEKARAGSKVSESLSAFCRILHRFDVAL
jgi:hypothetical protein